VLACAFALLLGPALALAAEPGPDAPTLAGFMAAAVKRHPRGVVARVATETARLDAARARSDLLPTLRATAGWTFNQFDAVFDPDGEGPAPEFVIVPRNQFDATITASAPLFDGPAMVRRDALEKAVNASQQEARVVERDVRLEVARAWYLAVASQELETAARRARAAAVDNRDMLQKRFDAGAETDLAVQRADVEVANAERVVADARRSALAARRTLATLTGLPEPAQLPVASATAPAVPAEDALVTQAESTNPELLAARARVEQLTQLRDGAWLAWTPSVAATVSERLTNAAGFQGQYATFSAGVQLQWLAFDFGGRESEIRRADLTLESALASLQRTRETVRDAIHSAALDVEAARVKLAAANRGVEVARKAAATSRERFNARTATQLDVIVADRDLLNLEVERIRAEGELALARLNMLAAAGLPLDDATPPGP